MLSCTSSAVFCKGPLSQNNTPYNSGDLLKEINETNTTKKSVGRKNWELTELLAKKPEEIQEQLEMQIDHLKDSIYDIQRELKDLVGTRKKMSETRMSNAPSDRIMTSSSSQRLHTRQTRVNLAIASMSHFNIRKEIFQQSIPSQPTIKSNNLLYLPLSKLLKSPYVRQTHPNQIKVFSLDKSLKIGAGRTYTCSSKIQIEPNSLVFEVFKDLSPNQVFNFYCMKGTHKGQMLRRILDILGDTVKGSENIRFVLAEVIYTEKCTMLHAIIQEMWHSILLSQEHCQSEMQIEQLEVQLQDAKQRYSFLKKQINDQVQLNQNKNRSLWQEVKLSLRRNLVIRMKIENEENSNIAFLFCQGKPSQKLVNRQIISDMAHFHHYNEICSQLEAKVKIFCLNPQISMHRTFQEYLTVCSI